jgi:type III secretion protein V
LQKLRSFIYSVNRYNDILLVVLVIAIIGLMILPLPTFLVDALIAVNLAISCTMLMIAMYIPGALEFSVFPSMLLFTTLFRLALNITTTRLILLKADAGEIIYTFGNFVVSGNFVVGAVIFLILTIVQFLVIAKGSERVAEVGARFTLDAMPGKQMSIDADMRAGVIDMDQARERREKVTKESQLYGAMDGAMKFVKGDAIAGLIVTVINLVGGIGIGVMQKGMTAEAAVQKYAILTIGDGLVSQIPSLLISITAGIIVTRVSSTDSEHLGGDIGKQFMARPKALIIGGVMLFMFGMIPGFPKPQFFALGTVILVTGVGLSKFGGETEEETSDDQLAAALAPAQEKDKPKKRKMTDVEDFSITVPLLIDLAENIRALIKADDLNEEIISIRRALYYDLGVPFPGIHLRFRQDAEDDSYTIMLQEVPITLGWLKPGKVLVRETEEHIKVVGIKYEVGKNFLPGLQSIWVDEADIPALDSAGFTYMSVAEVLSYHLSFVLKRHAGSFIGIQETRYLLSQMEAKYGELVKEVQRIMPLQKIAEIFQRLVSEEISVRNLRGVLEAFVEWGQKEKDTILLTEYVRGSLKRQICFQYTAGQNTLPVYMLTPETEDKIRGSIRQTSSGSFLALDPDKTAAFVQNVKKEVGQLQGMSNRPVLLTSMDIRRYVRKLIEGEMYDLPVLSYQEMTPEVTVQPLGKIGM